MQQQGAIRLGSFIQTTPAENAPPPAPDPQKTYCDVCDRHFKSPEGFQRHVKESGDHRKAVRMMGKRAERTKAAQLASGSGSAALAPENIEDKFFYHGNYWSLVREYEFSHILFSMRKNEHTPEQLVRSRYVVKPYTRSDMTHFDTCRRCKSKRPLSGVEEKPCRFHPGVKPKKDEPYSCCKSHSSACSTAATHQYVAPTSSMITHLLSFAAAPARSPNPAQRRRTAVALDCEMASAYASGGNGIDSSLTMICAIDVFTGETLINTLVAPTLRIRDWRTRVSGVTQHNMDEAIRNGEALLGGWEAARAALWEFIGPETILIGHALQHDLEALHMAHSKIVDSQILCAATPGGQVGLGRLCEELLGLYVQLGEGNGGHDCKEDVLGAREVVLWCLRYPERLQAWQTATREKEKAEKAERQRLRAEKEEAEKKKRGRNEQGRRDGRGLEKPKKDGETGRRIENRQPENIDGSAWHYQPRHRPLDQNSRAPQTFLWRSQDEDGGVSLAPAAPTKPRNWNWRTSGTQQQQQ